MLASLSLSRDMRGKTFRSTLVFTEAVSSLFSVVGRFTLRLLSFSCFLVCLFVFFFFVRLRPGEPSQRGNFSAVAESFASLRRAGVNAAILTGATERDSGELSYHADGKHYHWNKTTDSRAAACQISPQHFNTIHTHIPCSTQLHIWIDRGRRAPLCRHLSVC